MSNPNIYAQYIQPVRSVQDYQNDAIRGEYLQGQNEIQKAAIAQGQQQQAAAAARQNALIRIANDTGGDPDKMIPALYQSGFVDVAQGLEKHRADIGKTKAETTSKAGEATDAALKRFRGALDFIDTPQGAARWLQAQYQDPVTGPLLQSIRPFEEAVQGIPQDPAQFQQWRLQAGVGMEKVSQWAKEREIAAQQTATTIRGQDLTAATARRGQDISAATTRRGQDLTNARAMEANQGGGAKPSAAQERADLEKAKAGRQGEQMVAAIEQARQLLGKNPTASGVGSLVDKAGRAVGVTSESAKTAAQLETLSGWMVANVPRMEGPQSNFDVENYKTMAAKVGDRSVPIPERLAALSTLEELHRKYAEINGTPLPAAPSRAVDTKAGVPTIKFLGFE